ncbi:MAG TPA: hypothetical protein DC047_14515 [Blastocatellia bacterium]|nr:hypothetical protein [Blastocatellia bacterium]
MLRETLSLLRINERREFSLYEQMKLRMNLDILVVGGGPSGAACATVLARGGARVAVVESGDFNRFRIGETIHATTRPLLARLGCPMPANDNCALPSLGVASAWGDSRVEVRPSIMNPYGRGWRVERRTFDKRLFENSGDAGAALFTKSRVEEVRRDAGKWTFSIVSDGKILPGTAPFVVEATGRNGKSKFAPNARRHWGDRLVGLAIFSKDYRPVTSRFADSALVESTPLGWWYSVLLPDQGTLGVFFTDGDLLPRNRAQVGLFLQGQIQETEHTRDHCPILENGPYRWKAFNARSGIRRLAVADGWVAIGDALMAFDPLSGLGVTEAISSGISAAEWWQSLQSPRIEGIPFWVEQVSERFNEYLKARLLTYSSEKRWPDSPFWRRRQRH